MIQYQNCDYIITEDSQCNLMKCYSNENTFFLPTTVIDGNGKEYIISGVGIYAFIGCSSCRLVLYDDSKVFQLNPFSISNSLIREISVSPNFRNFPPRSLIYSDFKPCAHIKIPSESKYLVSTPEKTICRKYPFHIVQGVKNSIIRESALHINNYAFFRLNNLTYVRFPSSIKSIGDHSYAHSSIKVIIFNSNSRLEVISSYAFCNTIIKKISFPDSLEIIEFGAFSNCYKLMRIYFGDKSKLNSIGKTAFYKTSLVTVNFPPSLEVIDESAFSRINGLKQVTFPQDSRIKIIKQFAFEGNNLLKNIKYPDSIVSCLKMSPELAELVSHDII